MNPLFRQLARLAHLAVASASLLSAQSVSPAVVELDLDSRKSAGITFVRDANKKVAVLRIGAVEVPLVHPVSNCAIARAKGGRWLVLAGGVHDSLDLYLIGKEGGRKYYQTEGGRRMSPEFNDRRGSWPVVEGTHLISFVFTRNGEPHFRALDFKERIVRVQSSRTLHPSVTGFKMDSNKDGLVSVRFTGSKEVTEFEHPLAPRLEIKPSSLMPFGASVVGTPKDQLLTVVNTGVRSLNYRVADLPPGFSIVGSDRGRIRPGQPGRLRVRFLPSQPGPIDARMILRSNGVLERHVIVLRASVTAAPARRGPVGKAVPDRPARPGAKSLPPVPQPRLAVLRIDPEGNDRVLVQGRLAISTRLRLAILGGVATEALCEADGAGGVHAHLVAPPGTALQVVAIGPDGRRSTPAAIGSSPAMLRSVRGRAEVRGRPGQRFLLVAHADGDIIKAWRSQLDTRGRGSIDLAVLGKRTPGPSTRLALTVIVAEQGQTRASRSVEVDPDNR